MIPGASELVPAGPAGGYLVSFRDPDNLPCNLVWGLEERTSTAETSTPTINYPVHKPRKGEFRRCVIRNSLYMLTIGSSNSRAQCSSSATSAC